MTTLQEEIMTALQEGMRRAVDENTAAHPDAPKWWCGGCSPEHYGIFQLNPDTPYRDEPCSSCAANQRAEIIESLPELVGELQSELRQLKKRVSDLEGREVI